MKFQDINIGDVLRVTQPLEYVTILVQSENIIVAKYYSEISTIELALILS
jgi:hypothetical protein